MIIHSSLTPIIIPLYGCYAVFLYGLCNLFTGGGGGGLTKQTNKTVTRLAKRSFKTQLKNTLIKLKFSEAFGEK